MIPTKLTKIFALIFILIFILTEYVFVGRIESISGYAAYYFEILWIAAILLVFRGFNWFSKQQLLKWLGISVLVGAMGALVQVLAFQLGITIAFDMESTETLVFLLLIGPVLEEFLFRLGLWKVVEVLLPPRKSRNFILILITAALFSYSHFRMIDRLPPAVQDFVKYQTAYTLVLGLLCGWLRSGFGMAASLLAHMLFNLGFWLAR